MLNDFSWNMTGYILKHQVNPHGDDIIPYVAERIFQLEPEPPSVGNLNEYILSALHEKILLLSPPHAIGVYIIESLFPEQQSGVKWKKAFWI